MKVISLIDTISKLEDAKWQLIMQGAEVRPELQMQILLIDLRLNKLYAWYSSAIMNGLVTEQPQISFEPAIRKKPERRRKVLKA